MNFKTWRAFNASFIAFVFVGCQSYEPAPLDIGLYHNALETRLVDIEPVIAFAERLAIENGVPAQFDITDGISPAEGEVIALFYNPELRIARLEAGVALANFETAGLWQDPVFGFDGAEISSPSAPFEFGLMGNITIPISGRLKVEKARAGTQYETQLREVVNAEWNTRASLRNQWAIWTAATLRVELTREVLEQLKNINMIAETLKEAGEINRVQHRLLLVEIADNEVLKTEVELQLLQAEIELLAIMGLPPDASSSLIPDFPSVQTSNVDNETIRLVDANTVLAIRFSQYQTAEESLRLEIRKQYPDIVIGSGYGSEFNDHRVLFGLSIPIPIINANKAAIANAKMQRDVARAEAETTFARLYRELALANTTLQFKQTQQGYYTNEIIPLLTEQASDLERIVRLGEFDTFILLQSITRQFQAKQQLLDLQVAQLHAAIQVHTILGPEYQLNPTPFNRELQPTATLGGVQ